MDFFEDLANKGEIYSALEKQGLIRNLYDRECLDQAYDEGWDHGIDWDDEDDVGQLKQARVFFIYYDYSNESYNRASFSLVIGRPSLEIEEKWLSLLLRNNFALGLLIFSTKTKIITNKTLKYKISGDSY